MASRYFRFIGDRVVEVGVEPQEPSSEAPFVITDDMPQGLKHPVTGEVFTSKSKFQRCTDSLNMVCVGNELLSQKPHKRKEFVTEEKVLRAMEKAESTLSDPSKARAWRNQQREKMERLVEVSKNMVFK